MLHVYKAAILEPQTWQAECAAAHCATVMQSSDMLRVRLLCVYGGSNERAALQRRAQWSGDVYVCSRACAEAYIAEAANGTSVEIAEVD